MAQILRMPAVSANAERAVLLTRSIGEKASYATDDTLAEIETDKAVVDLDAESDGVLIKWLVPAGAEVEVGAPIAVLGHSGEGDVDITALLTELGVTVSATTEPSSNGGSIALPDEPTAHAAATVGETAEPLTTTDDFASTGDALTVAPAADGSRTFASPLARQMARAANLPLSELTGSGPGGRIRRDDVRTAIKERRDHPAQPTPSPVTTDAGDTAPPQPESISIPAPVASENWIDEPHNRLRTLIAGRLTTSKSTVPHFYLSTSARVDRLLALRAEVNASQPVKVSVNDMLIAAAARAHGAVPGMNCIWTEAALRRFTTVDVSVAVASKKGLVTPTLHGVETLSITAIASQTRDLVAKADSGRLRPEDLEGGSLTISNLGMFGVEDFAAIINPPQSAILAVGAARQEAVVIDGRLEVGTVLRMTLSVDHRAVDGALAAQWFAELVALLENPMRVLT